MCPGLSLIIPFFFRIITTTSDAYGHRIFNVALFSPFHPESILLGVFLPGTETTSFIIVIVIVVNLSCSCSVLVAASPFWATKPPVPIYIRALLLRLRRRASARWTVSNNISFLKRPIRLLQYGSKAIGNCVVFYHTYRRTKTECLHVMESLVYENSPLADYLQGEYFFGLTMLFG